jgi:epoxyqueuosine reductase QueG
LSPRLPRFLEWLERGFEGDMASLRRPGRRAPLERQLPGIRSVLAFLFPHPFDPALSLTPPKRGEFRTAQYTLVEDYHRRIRRALLPVARSLPGRARLYCDTGPLFEKELAERAGLGFVGKNTLLIHPRLGSALNLGIILAQEPLQGPPPRPMPSCGSCRRCLEVCPTGALAAPYTLDTRRCIAYLTMEAETPPTDPRERWGYIYGCDLCQAVCPFNRHGTPGERLPAPDLKRVPPERLARNRELADSAPAPIVVKTGGRTFPLNPALAAAFRAALGTDRGLLAFDGRGFRMDGLSFEGRGLGELCASVQLLGSRAAFTLELRPS